VELGWLYEHRDFLRPSLAKNLGLKGPLQHDRTAQVLHMLLVALTGWTFLILPLANTASAWVDVSLLLTYLAALIMLRRGTLANAGRIYLVGSFLARTADIVANGGTDAVSTVYYLVLPISAAWLLGLRASLLSAAACLACLLAMAGLEHVQTPAGYFPGSPLHTAAILFEAMVIGTFPVARMLQVLHEALTRSRSAEQALQQYQMGLETLVRQRTAELEQARDQAEAANRAKSAFLATVSHELRSPLNTILLLSDPEWIDPATSASTRQDLHLMRRSGESLLHLIDDVLDSARIDAGDIALENVTFDLGALVREVIERMQERTREKGLALSVEPRPGLPRLLCGDASKLRHILINLMDNAVKYTDRGMVTLRVDCHRTDAVGCVRLSFEIADTGVGIAAEDQARVFEPFTRVGSVEARGGTGLGLSIARQYVLLMGGSIRLASAPGEGARIFVDVPAVLDATEGKPARSTRRIVGLSPGQPEYRVLIVDDRPEDRMVLRRILEENGFQVQAAENGESAIELFQAWRPHFIWMDRRMPLMDGLEATRQIRALEGGSAVKIVGLSASAFPSERAEMLAAGLQDFIRKPYTPDDVLECMERHLGVRYEYAARRQTA
jgi:signal transduction histidine kinase/ActR/RegA family two-component response regulator